MDHAAESHVHKCVDPEWSEEDEELLGCCKSSVELVKGAERAKDVASCLPSGAHDEDPGVAFLVEDCLQDVSYCRDAEEAGKRNGGAE